MNENTILLAHGSGGKLTRELIKELFYRYFSNSTEIKDADSASVNMKTSSLGFTTDSFVVNPLFFPGGNIGHLAVSGTVNDLAVSGYLPRFISTGFIIEEGFSLKELEIIVKSMAEEAEKAGVQIVTGDTKVVNRGKCDKLFINTSGIGELVEGYLGVGSPEKVQPGDQILVNGSIADHGMAVMAAREGLSTKGLQSDVAPLNRLIGRLTDAHIDVKFMRDATRGGLATVLNEIVEGNDMSITINENDLLVNEGVKGLCELLGLDPLYVANEGKVVVVVAEHDLDKALSIMREHTLGRKTRHIGAVASENPGLVILNTQIGGNRIVDMLAGDQLPRIC